LSPDITLTFERQKSLHKTPEDFRAEKGAGLNGTNLRCNPFSQYDLAGRVTYTDNTGSVDMPQVQLRSHYDYEGKPHLAG
jgi:hypothetical protein